MIKLGGIAIIIITLLTLTSTVKVHASLENVKSPELVTTDTEGIAFFEGDWQSALMLAKKEGKMIFLDAYASWCGPCKMMEHKTFKDEKVIAFFNAHFINVKMDMEKHPEGERLAKKFNLTIYPTLYFMQYDEALIDYALGYHKPKHLLDVANSAEITFRKM